MSKLLLQNVSLVHDASYAADQQKPAGRAAECRPAGEVHLAKPHRINAWRGATSEDVTETINRVELCFDLFVSAMAAHLQNLRENLPLDAPAPDIDSFLGSVADIRSDLVHDLMRIEDQLS